MVTVFTKSRRYIGPIIAKCRLELWRLIHFLVLGSFFAGLLGSGGRTWKIGIIQERFQTSYIRRVIFRAALIMIHNGVNILLLLQK